MVRPPVGKLSKLRGTVSEAGRFMLFAAFHYTFYSTKVIWILCDCMAFFEGVLVKCAHAVSVFRLGRLKNVVIFIVRMRGFCAFIRVIDVLNSM